MQSPEIPENEKARIEALRELEILNTRKEPAFDRITSLAATLYDVPIAAIALIDEHGQWLKSNYGGILSDIIPRELAFCGHTILHNVPMVVEDAEKDIRFSDNPLVAGNPHIRFYAGAPLTTSSGYNIGAMCIIDHKPRQLTPLQEQVLSDLAGIVMSEFELRRMRKDAVSQFEVLAAAFDVLPDGVVLMDDQFRCRYVNKALLDMFGLKNAAEVYGWTPEDAAAYMRKFLKKKPIDVTAGTDWRSLQKEIVLELIGPKPRIVRRSTHKIKLSSRPFMSLWSDITYEAEELARKERETLTDPLTGAPNRKAGDIRIAQLLTKGGFSAVLFDIDHFKAVNDTYGHVVGDEVLKLVSHALRANLREGEMVCRWGGEEFLAFIDADASVAKKFAERARKSVEDLVTVAGKVTISAGVAFGSTADVVKEADKKLYEAKKSGRNQVCY